MFVVFMGGTDHHTYTFVKLHCRPITFSVRCYTFH